MQVIYQNEVERKHGGRADTMGVDICARRIGRCVEGECDGGTRSGGGGIQVCGKFFYNIKKGIWWRRRGVSKGGRTEKVGARREDNGGVCSGVQEGSKRKWRSSREE